MKIKKKKIFLGGRVGGGGGRGGSGRGDRLWGQGECERRIQVFVKIQKLISWGGGGRVGGSGWMWTKN